MNDRPLIGVQLYNFDAPVPLDALPEVVDTLRIELSFAPLHWGSVETEPGRFDWSALERWERAAEILGPRMPRLIWTIYPVHMNERGPLPPDLTGEPFDSPRMAERFDAFIAEAATRAGWGDQSIVMVGNEIDMWYDGHKDELDAWLAFSESAASSIHRHAPGALVSNSLTHDALVWRGGPDLIRAVNQSSDIVAFQWYDLDRDLRVRELHSLEDVVQQWAAVADGKPLLLSEIGMATGAPMGSSDDFQVRRVEELFDVLARRTRSEMLGAVWLGLDDWDVEQLRQWIVGQFPSMAGDDSFLSYLTTLGLRTYDGTPKPGYHAWVGRAADWR